MKEMKMLDIDRVALDDLAQALEDHSDLETWWIDPATGAIEPWTRDLSDDVDPPSERGFRRIEPLPSGESYADMEEFAEQVRDRGARDALRRAIAGRGAFRRFKDTLSAHPDLRKAWFSFHDARMRRRAIEWLGEQGLVDEEEVEAAVARHPDPVLPALAPALDVETLARSVAAELKVLYGERLRRVLLFGSRARGDADPESDVDLLVVLDEVPDPYLEIERMDQILWQSLLDTGIVVSAIPISEREAQKPRTMAIMNALAEGREIL